MKLHVIVDLQYGSTGKGLFAGYLAKKLQPDTIITAWGPNAGHTYVDEFGTKFVNIAIPNGIVESTKLKRVLLGPGSVINPEILEREIKSYAPYFGGVEILIHPHAAVVTDSHRDAEARYGFKIGSTMKGVGEALCDKIRRVGDSIAGAYKNGWADHVCTVEEYDAAIDDAKVAIIEGAQGFSLSINHGFYPYVTSRDCTVQQALVDCAIPLGNIADMKVYGVCRTYPIRVANRFDAEGRQVGTSGPCYSDQVEIEWSDLGLEPELTTVTKLPRRIFTFSKEQIRRAVRMNSVDYVFLNFCNYNMTPFVDGPPQVIVDAIEDNFGPSVEWLGYGPRVTDIKER